MTKRQAKAEACRHAALVLESTFDLGCTLLTNWPAEDETKILMAMQEVIEEFNRRSISAPDTPPKVS